MGFPQITLRHRHQIDLQRWDALINGANNGRIYVYSWYLDAFCDNWSALILGDYEALMPLPWRKKWGVAYVYQPPFLQHLGIFGDDITEQTWTAFLAAAAHYFKLIHFNTNGTVLPQPYTNKLRQNFYIDLSDDYLAIAKKYNIECKRNIAKAKARGCVFSTDITAANVVQLYKQAYGSLNRWLTENDYKKLLQLLENHAAQATLAAVRDADKNIIYAAAIVHDNRRFYYLLGAPTAEGRKKRATYFFIDAFLHMHAGKKMLFDFEGSDIPTVARFYKSFGPQTEQYSEIKINNLPPLLKWLKR